jgi:YggT family protein
LVAAFLLQLINWVFTLYSFAFIIRAFLSWFRVDYYHPVVRFLIQITEPPLMLLRRYIPPVGGLDFTPMVALMALWFIERLLRTVILTLF